MWQGINNITGFKGNKPATVNIAASLPDELNTFYARFEADNTAHTESAPAAAGRRGESTLAFCRGCNPILQTGEHPKSCGPGWYTWLCAQSMHFPASRGFLQTFSICPSLCLWFPHASKNPPLCPYLIKIKSHA